MSGYDLLKNRMAYRGTTPQKRLDRDKDASLKAALTSAYQSEVIEIANGGLFRALINPDKLTEDIDCKILSVPYRDVCLNYSSMQDKYTIIKERIEDIDIKEGDVVTWMRTRTHWLVYLQYIEESAYFRSQILRCSHDILINDTYYYIHFRNKTPSNIKWSQKEGIYWNELNCSALFYITNNQETRDYFKRFTKIKIAGNTWEVQSAQPANNGGVLLVLLKEFFNNSIADAVAEQQIIEEEFIDISLPHIIGEATISPYDIKTYEIMNADNGGIWELDTNKVKIKEVKNNCVTIEVITGRSANFNLKYKINDKEIVFPITIKSL